MKTKFTSKDHSKEHHDEHIMTKDSWRIFRIMSEFVDGFEAMLGLGPAVSIFGSARLSQETAEYQLAQKISFEIAKKGFSIVTGGGPGIMEAANRGCSEASGISAGVSVKLPFETGSNPYVSPKYNLVFRYFFIRKVILVRYAKAFVVMPGGLGTLDELFEALTLIQTQKTHSIPLILVGKEYWKGLLQWLQETVLKKGCIKESDLDLITLCDDPKEIATIIASHYEDFNDIEHIL